MENGRDFSSFRWPEKTKAPDNQKEKKELKERLQKEFAGAVLKWMDVLETKLANQKPKMSESRRLGAIFGPVALFTLLVGCGDLKKIDCSAEDSDLLQASIDWISDHPTEIETKMKELWPNSSISAKQIIKTLKEADIACAEDRGAENDVAGTANQMTGRILIDVNSDGFKESLTQYQNGQWIESSSLNDIIEQVDQTETGGDKQAAINEIYQFYQAIGFVSDTLVHEAVHFELGHHSNEVKQKVEEISTEIQKDPYAYQDLETLDEIYAWGAAASRAANYYGGEVGSLAY